MTRDELREQINLMEALEDVVAAADDVSGVEFEPGQRALVNLDFVCTDGSAPIVTAYAIPQQVAIAGLRAMQIELENMVARIGRTPVETTT